MPRGDLPHAAKTIATGANVRLENRPDTLAKTKIDVSDYSCADAALAVTTAWAHRRSAIEKLGFADWPHFRNDILAIHRAALYNNGGANIVAGAEVSQEIRKKVSILGAPPQMVMRVDNSQVAR